MLGILPVALLSSTVGCSANWEHAPSRSTQALDPVADAGLLPIDQCPVADGSGGTDAETPGLYHDDDGSFRVQLSEVVIDPPGADGNNEFIEIQGDDCARLSRLYLVCVEGDNESNSGAVDRVIDLNASCGPSPCRLGTDGRLVLSAPNGWQRPSESNATWAMTDALSGGGLENGTTTLLLLQCADAPTLGDDWDPGDTGTLQLPSTCDIVDSLSWLDRATGDFPYSSAVIGPKPGPNAAVRCDGLDGRANWYFGPLVNGAQGITFAGVLSAEAPTGARLTPGMPNECVSHTIVPDAGSEDTVQIVDAAAPAADARVEPTSSPDAGAISSGSSDWWEPDVPGTWPDSGAIFDASVVGADDGTNSKGAPKLPQPGCSFVTLAPSSRTSTLALLSFMLLARGVVCPTGRGRRRFAPRASTDPHFAGPLQAASPTTASNALPKR